MNSKQTNSIISSLKNILLHKDEIDFEELSRRRLFLIFIIIMIIPLIIFGIVKLKEKDFLIAVTDLMAAAFFISFIIIQGRLKRVIIFFRITLLMVLFLCLFWIYRGVNDGASTIWIIALPPFSFFLLGRKEGSVWSAVILLSSALIFFHPFIGDMPYSYTDPFIIRHLGTLSIVILFTYNFEAARMKFKAGMENKQARLLEERNNLDEANLQLQEEIEERERIEDELKIHKNYLEELVANRTDELMKKNIELAESEKRYRMMADNIAETIWTMGFNRQFTYVSPAIEKLRGYSVEEAVEHTLDQITTPESLKVASKIFDEMKDLASSGKADSDSVYTIELEIYRKDGSTIWISNTVSYLWDENMNCIGLLGVSADINERKKMEDQLRASLQEKDILLKELYHRTKNNMQVICGMIGLIATKPGNEALTDVLEEIELKIQTMALVHQQLYESMDLAHINLRSYVANLTSYILGNYHIADGKVSLQQDVDNIDLSIDIAIPFGLVLNELLTNSLKHAFSGKVDNKIIVQISKTEDGFLLKYRDNGIGLPEDFDPDKSSSLGMKIMEDIIKNQLKGNISIKSGNGFFCDIEILIKGRKKRMNSISK